MPPFLPRKRVRSTSPSPPLPPPAKISKSSGGSVRKPKEAQPPKSGKKRLKVVDSDSESSLSDLDSDEFEDVATSAPPVKQPDSEEEEEDIDWEDAAPKEALPPPPGGNRTINDIQLTLPKNDDTIIDYGTTATKGKTGPTKREKVARTSAHTMHVQFLLYHNAIRNNWISDKEVQQNLVKDLPSQIRKQVQDWRVASGLVKPEKPQNKTTPIKTKVKGRRKDSGRDERDWGRPSQRLEEGKPNMSNGDPLIHLMKVLSAYWKKRFAITAPGLRKRGYGTKLALKQEIHSLRHDPHDPEKHGERISNLEEFRKLARQYGGSRDVGAQLFTALLRGLGIEARIVASLQPTGFGWIKAEQMLPKVQSSVKGLDAPVIAESGGGKKTAKSLRQLQSTAKRKHAASIEHVSTANPSSSEDSISSDDESLVDVTPSVLKARPAKYDRQLMFPIYWTEVVSPITNIVLPVSPLVLEQAVASTPETLAAFEPRGAKAEKGKQVMAYVISYSPDGSAKDVTVRYLKKHIWPGKTRGFRMPVEKIPVYDKHGKVKRYEDFDWFKTAMSPYVRLDKSRTAADDIEDSTDLVRKEAEKKVIDEDVDTLQSLKASADFVLERHLRREEALLPGAEPVRMFVSGKGDKIQEEPVYKRSDVERCLTAESWHKEGRRPKEGEQSMKLVPVRAVTLTRKREAEEHERQTGEKQMQGLYSRDQTEYIIPPPIKDGIIPKNGYGNMDCFVPSMVPRGAVHIPLKGTVRICKKLEIDFAEAVTGFEFGNKRAVPVCTGVVVAEEHEDAVRAAWKEWNAMQKKKEEGKLEKLCLDLWRKMLMGLRIRERIEGEYVDDDEEVEVEAVAIEAEGTAKDPIDVDSVAEGPIDDRGEDYGGGFLLPHEDDEDDDQGGGDLVMESGYFEPVSAGKRKAKATEQYPTPSSIPAKVTRKMSASQPARDISDSLSASDLSDDLGTTESDSDTPTEEDQGTNESEIARPPPLRRKRGLQVSATRTSSSTSSASSSSSSSSSTPTLEPQLHHDPNASTNSSDSISTSSSSTSSDEESEYENEFIPPARPFGKTARRPPAKKNTASTKSTTASTPRSQRPRSTNKTAKAEASMTGAPRSSTRRSLRRDSTVVTSPYFED